MEALPSVCIALLCITGLLGVTGNGVSIFCFVRWRPLRKTLDITSLRIMVQVAACNLFLCVVNIPLLVWNLAEGSATTSAFYDNSIACWLSISTLVHGIYTIQWLMLALATIRLLAVFKPEFCEVWIQQTRFVRWLCYTVSSWQLGSDLTIYITCAYNRNRCRGSCRSERCSLSSQANSTE